ncbi:MAG TPA: MATE family efflux transporter [Polyangiaceae bacterium]|nr:MATE family efflux transporter [Polyangiaceae bacterium]
MNPAATPERPAAAAETRTLDHDIWAMAWPAMLSFLVVNVVDVTDVAFVGRLGRHTVAAWSYAAQCVHLVETLVQSVGVGCVALMARAAGARDPARARRVLAGSILVSQAVALLGLLLAVFAPRRILALLGAEPDVIETAVPYLRLFASSMVLYAAAFMFESGLRAHKSTRGPMLIAIVVMTVKAILSFGLIFGAWGLPRLGLVGAGAATVAAHAVGLVLYVAIARVLAREGLAVTFRWRDLLAGRQSASETLAVSLPTMGERLIMSLALLTYFKILSSYGTAAIAAYGIGVRLLSFSWAPGLGFGAAASTFVGQALGANDSRGARRVGYRSVRLALIVMCALGVAFFLFRRQLAGAFTNDPQVVEDLVPFMMMLAIAQPFMGSHFTLGGVLRGAGDTVTPLVGAAVGNWGFRVPLAWLFTRAFGHRLGWVWASLIADHFVRMTINAAAFVRGRWARRTGATLRGHGGSVADPVGTSRGAEVAPLEQN